MTDLVPLVNRFRSQGYKYEQVKEKLVKMGNTAEAADSAIAAYIKEILE